MQCDLCGTEYPRTPGYMKEYCDFVCERCLLVKKLHPDIFQWVVDVAKKQAAELIEQYNERLIPRSNNQ